MHNTTQRASKKAPGAIPYAERTPPVRLQNGYYQAEIRQIGKNITHLRQATMVTKRRKQRGKNGFVEVVRSMSQAELAQALCARDVGVRQSNISDMEAGKFDICYTTLIAIADVFERTVVELLTYHLDK